MTANHNYSIDEISWMHENRAKYVLSEYTRQFNAIFGTAVSSCALNTYAKKLGISTGRDGRFKKGQNGTASIKKGERISKATEFKKGYAPHNTLPIGTESTDNKDGYTKVKVAQPNVWKFKHIMLWEQCHGKTKPKQAAIVFLDNDRKNFAKDNLQLISRSALATCNKLGYMQHQPPVKRCLIAIAELKVKSNKIIKHRPKQLAVEISYE